MVSKDRTAPINKYTKIMNKSKKIVDPFLDQMEENMEKAWKKLSEEEKKHFKEEREDAKRKIDSFRKEKERK